MKRILKTTFFFFITSFLDVNASVYPIFNDEITLSEFGLTTNQNISIQPSGRYPLDFLFMDQMKTNNYQTLQLNFGEYTNGRYPCRIGMFNISECANTVDGIPFGTMISLPAYTIDGDSKNGVEPNRYLIQTRDPSYWVFSFTETLDYLSSDFSESETGQVASMWYHKSGYTSFMRNMNLSLSAYHDIQYEDVTPKIVLGKGRVFAIELNGVAAILPTTGTSVTLPPANKFKFVINNEPEDPQSQQTWLFYVQSDTAATNIEFVMNYEIDKDGHLYNIVLTSAGATSLFSGYLRVAAIQTNQPKFSPNPLKPRTTPDWELAAQIQSIPSTPLSMFMLWPTEWVKRAGQQIKLNQEGNVFLSSYSTVSLLLPLLAGSDFQLANEWFNQLVDKQNEGQDVFDIGTNSFVTLFNMLIAKYYKTDISNFQAGIARGVSTPNLFIQPDAVQMEMMFDNHRSEIVLSNEIQFNLDGSYQFNVSSLDVITTFPQSSAVLPLFSFLGYQTIADGFNIVSNATNIDGIKGYINYAQGNIWAFPGSYYLQFKAQSLPSWAPRFIPDDFWTRLSGAEKTNLLCQLNLVLKKPLPGYTKYVYNQGKILFQLAMTAKYATYLLLAQQKTLPPYPKTLFVTNSIKAKVQPVIKKMEDVLNLWLLQKIYSTPGLPNYFAADDIANGIIAILGASSPTGGTEDSGNAVYSGHNRQYGYFLAAAAVCAELDSLFKNPNWIATTVGGIYTIKQFVDMLWRDYANPSLSSDDADHMPFYRYGNAWEGISSSKGMPPTNAYPSRNNESISEDFNGYYAAYLYAVTIQSLSDAVIPTVNKQGFDGLQTFSLGNLNMITRAARALFYNDGNWVYKNSPFDFNTTTGIEWDNSVTSNVNFSKESPPAILTQEGALYSKYKFNLFCIELAEEFNRYCKPEKEGCGCQN